MNEDLSTLTNEQLQQQRANAYVTYCFAGGHAKASMNRQATEEYDAEIRRRDIFLEPLKGVFNGKGSR